MFSDLEINALRVSLKISIWSLLISLPIGLATSWVLARKDFFGKTLFNAVVHLPLIMPPVVIGYVLLLLLGRQGLLGKHLFDWFGITLVFTWQGAAIASAVVAFPLLVRPIRQSMESIDFRIEEAAKSLGAKPRQVFIFITLPMLMPGILTGSLLFFARALGEFGATITFAANIPGETQSIPLALYSASQTPNSDATALRLVMISATLAVAAIMTSELLNRKYNNKLRAR